MTHRTLVSRIIVVLPLVAVAACASPDVTTGVYDPYEAQNRKVHEENRKLDEAIIRPLANGYGTGVPPEVRIAMSNVASNLDLPGVVLNDLLQFKIGEALHNTARFVVNTTIGVGGLFDPASGAGLDKRDTDFGETLHVWGFGQGAYVELPLLGPSTERDAIGGVVDLAMNPLNMFVEPPTSYVLPAAKALNKFNSRYTFGSSVDSVLYESEDSYAQARLLYLENRNYELGIEAAEEELYDIYEELYE